MIFNNNNLTSQNFNSFYTHAWVYLYMSVINNNIYEYSLLYLIHNWFNAQNYYLNFLGNTRLGEFPFKGACVGSVGLIYHNIFKTWCCFWQGGKQCKSTMNKSWLNSIFEFIPKQDLGSKSTFSCDYAASLGLRNRCIPMPCSPYIDLHLVTNYC